MRTKGLKLLAVGVLLSLPWSIGSAQNQALSAPANYVVTNLGGLGGTQSVAYGVNDLGLIAGTSTLSGDANEHGFLWILGLKVDLGTFGGPNSEAVFAPNIVGQITGAAETSTPDPLGEDFCASGTNLTCVPFIWQLGLKIQLRTLGGHNGEGVDINDLGQVVGGTETAVHDATCQAPQVLQILPAVWTSGQVKALPTFAGDPDGFAEANNDKGQIAGASGNCTSNPAAHALLWQNGKAINLGSLGGTMNNAALDINAQGDVAGYSNVTGDTTTHAFLWRNGKMTDLGTLQGDVSSYAYGINSRDQVVGESCDANGNCRAFLWQNSAMTDVNTLIPANSPLYLVAAFDINNLGAIVGFAYQQSTNSYPAYLAIPASSGAKVVSSIQANAVARTILPDSARKITQPQVRRGRAALGLATPQ